jgi:hypothetical protein
MDHLPAQAQLVPNLLRHAPAPKLSAAQTYLSTMFPGLEATPLGVTFEEIIGPLEIAESDQNWFHFVGKSSSSRLITNQVVLDSLDTWLAQALDPATLPSLPPRTDPNHAHKLAAYHSFYRPAETALVTYARLLHFLDQKQLLDQVAFVSFNYDLLLDRCLFASSHAPEYEIDLFTSRDGAPKTPVVPLLKLHGSLNWRLCAGCHTLQNTREYVVWPQSQCNDCGNRIARPMLIRPTLLKDFKHRVWRDIWKHSGRLLAGASTWIFVGYSLPLADVWMLRVLLQSMRSGGVGGRRDIIVVNPNAQVGQRFKLLFPSAKHRAEKFDEWVAASVARGAFAS